MRIQCVQRQHQLHVLIPRRADRPHSGHGCIIAVYRHQTRNAAFGFHLIHKIRCIQAALRQRRLHIVDHYRHAPGALRVVFGFGKAGIGVHIGGNSGIKFRPFGLFLLRGGGSLTLYRGLHGLTLHRALAAGRSTCRQDHHHTQSCQLGYTHCLPSLVQRGVPRCEIKCIIPYPSSFVNIL